MNRTRLKAYIQSITGIILAFHSSYATGSNHPARKVPLTIVANIPLPGSPTRFDYQNLNSKSGIDFISHMGSGQIIAFNTKKDIVEHLLNGYPDCTGVLDVPSLNRLYSSTPGTHSISVVNDRSLRRITRIGGPVFPDGIAWDPFDNRIFVSDEAGRAVWVVDCATNHVIRRISLKGEAGNTLFDPVTMTILVAVQTINCLARIDPRNLKVMSYTPLPGSEAPHGMYLNSPKRLVFIACQDNSRLLVVNLMDDKIKQALPVGNNPDVLAFDPVPGLLYVASEGGVVTVFKLVHGHLVLAGSVYARHAHSVAVNIVNHRVYIPLQNDHGHPVMRVYMPIPSLLSPVTN